MCFHSSSSIKFATLAHHLMSSIVVLLMMPLSLRLAYHHIILGKQLPFSRAIFELNYRGTSLTRRYS
jgi:hypothetical protein